MFINVDSIVAIDNTIREYEAIGSSLAASIELLASSRDRLRSVEDMIANGQPDLEAEKSELEMMIVEQQSDSAFFANENIGLDSVTQVLTDTKATINSGLIFVNSIEIIETGGFVTYEDSATSFSVPLSLDESFFNYQVTIGPVIDTFEVDYELFQEIDENRTILTRARNIEIIDFTENSFDSLDACLENCVDGQATFTIYF